MNRLYDKIEEAQKSWDRLKNSAIPVIYLGTASCGRAAGAMEVLESIRTTLEANRLEARNTSSGVHWSVLFGTSDGHRKARVPSNKLCQC